MKKKVLLVFGTRPEAIKMAPVVTEFKKHSDDFEVKVCVTAQHREMLDQVLSFFDIVPDYDLNLMVPGQTLYQLTANVINGMKDVLEDFRPGYVLVHGDTTTSTGAALAAFYSGAKVAHVEAGLRTFNKHSPFPEEMNRQITGRLADIHFAPTEESKQNLLAENINSNAIAVTGNTVIDALFYASGKVDEINDPEIERLKTIVDTSKKVILVTGHRRENFGEGFLNICHAIAEVSKRDDVQVIYPVHLNPNVQKPVYEILDGCQNICLIEPISYPAFVWLMKQCYLILTDSGGVQEEAPSLGKPVLVMRDTTERPEAVQAGTVILVGSNRAKIVTECNDLLQNISRYKYMQLLHNPYGDGQAAGRIVQFIKQQD